jgi:hypothetical protein
MASIDDEPSRLDVPGGKTRSPIPAVAVAPLPKPASIRASFLLALAERRSAERFTPVPLSDLATWLYYCASVQSVHADDPNRQRRFVASFGALHPAHIVLGSPSGNWSAYLPERHALGELAIHEEASRRLRAKAMELFEAPEATLVALVSDVDLVSSYYEGAFGLMLRDAGVLLGHAALVAAGLGLGFRILGSRGSSALEDLIRDPPFTPLAAGLAWIGGRAQAG